MNRKPRTGDRIGFRSLNRDGTWTDPGPACATVTHFDGVNPNVCHFLQDGRTRGDCFIWQLPEGLNVSVHIYE